MSPLEIRLPNLENALCRQLGLGHEPFYPEQGDDTRQAKRICEQCPDKAPCLQFALDNFEVGVWGGTNNEDRRAMRKANGAGTHPCVDCARPIPLRRRLCDGCRIEARQNKADGRAA